MSLGKSCPGAPQTCFLLLCLFAQLCLTLCDPMDSSLQALLSMRILQAGILEWVAMPSSRGTSRPRNQTDVSFIAGGFITSWATREAPDVLWWAQIWTSDSIRTQILPIWLCKDASKILTRSLSNQWRKISSSAPSWVITHSYTISSKYIF